MNYFYGNMFLLDPQFSDSAKTVALRKTILLEKGLNLLTKLFMSYLCKCRYIDCNSGIWDGMVRGQLIGNLWSLRDQQITDKQRLHSSLLYKLRYSEILHDYMFSFFKIFLSSDIIKYYLKWGLLLYFKIPKGRLIFYLWIYIYIIIKDVKYVWCLTPWKC
jgi:hypothetical protein